MHIKHTHTDIKHSHPRPLLYRPHRRPWALPGLSRAFRILLSYVFCTFTVLNFTNSLYCVLIQENNCFKDETQGCLPQSHVRMVSPVLMTYQHGPLGIGQPWKPQRCLMFELSNLLKYILLFFCVISQWFHPGQRVGWELQKRKTNWKGLISFQLLPPDSKDIIYNG